MWGTGNNVAPIFLLLLLLLLPLAGRCDLRPLNDPEKPRFSTELTGVERLGRLLREKEPRSFPDDDDESWVYKEWFSRKDTEEALDLMDEYK